MFIEKIIINQDIMKVLLKKVIKQLRKNTWEKVLIPDQNMTLENQLMSKKN